MVTQIHNLREKREQVEQKLIQVRAEVERLEAQRTVIRRGVLGSGGAPKLRDVETRLTTAKGQLEQLYQARTQARGSLELLRKTHVLGEGSIPPLTLSTHYPICLFPVRLEIRFPENVPELWVRIFPDEISIEQQRQDLTVKEAMTGLKFVTAEAAIEKKAATEEQKLAEKRAAWREAIGELGVPRAAWAIRQVRPLYQKHEDNNTLGTLETRLGQELQLGEEDDLVPAVVRTLPDRFVVNVYKYIPRVRDPNPVESQVISIQGNLIPDEVPWIADPYQPERSQSDKVVAFFRDASVPQIVARYCESFPKMTASQKKGLVQLALLLMEIRASVPKGKLVSITQIINWWKDPLNRVVYPELKLQQLYDTFIQPWDVDLLTGEAQWVVDFEEAVKIGMAVKIPLTRVVKPPFTRIVVVGVKSSVDPQEGAQMVEALITNHQYTDGFAFLEPGTPTNNTTTNSSGHSESRDDEEASFEAEILPVPPYEGDTNRSVMNRALGLTNLTVFDRVRNATQKIWSHKAEDLHEALWDGMGGFTLWSRYADLNQKEDRGDRRRFFSEFVRGQGHFPVFRVGNTPYGLLPVQRIAHESWRSERPYIKFETNLHKLVSHLFHHWLILANNASLVPRIGGKKANKTYQHEEELLQVLGMHPTNVDVQIRPFVEDRYFSKHIIEQVLKPAFVWAGFSGTLLTTVLRRASSQATMLWETQKKRKKAFLIELGRVLGIKPQDVPFHENLELAPLPIDPFPLDPIPLLKNKNLPLGETISPYGYLSELASGRPIKRESIQYPLPLLNEFLTRSIVQSISQGKGTEEEVQKAIRSLATLVNVKDLAHSEKVLDNLFRHALDVQSHRLDAWITAFAYQRLTTLRSHRIHPKGLHLGAYGWLENIEDPQEQSTETSSLSAGGYIHAPSMNQATAGAIVRNAFLTHADNPAGNPYALDLSSTRVRKALTLLDGVRAGQSLGELLGYQFERMLHDQNLDHYKDNFRDEYVWEDMDKPGSNVNGQPRRVVNGLALVQALAPAEGRTTQTKKQVMDEVGIPVSRKKERDQVADILTTICDLIDAMTDVLLYESTFQAVQGKWEHASAALKAFSAEGEGLPPVLESVRTPLSGVKFRNRVCLVLPGQHKNIRNREESAGLPDNPKGLIEPILEQWLVEIMTDSPTATAIGCQVILPHTGESETCTLEKLSLYPLDMLYWATSESQQSSKGSLPPDQNGIESTQPAAEETKVVGSPLAEWVRSQVRSQKGLSWNTEIIVNLNDSGNANVRPIASWVERIQAIWRVIGGSTWLKPQDVTVAQEDLEVSTEFQEVDVQNLQARVVRAQTMVKEGVRKKLEKRLFREETLRESGDLTNEDRSQVLEGLHLGAKFGLASIIPSGGLDDPHLRDQGVQMLKDLDTRMGDSGKLLSKGIQAVEAQEFPKAVQAFTEAIRGVFGKAFLVLPTFRVPAPLELDQALAQTHIVGPHGPERIRKWLYEMGQTQPKMEALDDAFMYLEVEKKDRTLEGLQLRVAQLPYAEDQWWLALSDSEQEEAKGKRKGASTNGQESEEPEDEDDVRRGKLSLVVVGPNSWKAKDHVIAGLLLDEMVEHLPEKTVTTGLSFQYDQPNSQPPHACLLAVPGEFNIQQPKPWVIDEVAEIVKDSMDLAKIRAADFDALQGMGEIFPALFLPQPPPSGKQTIDFGDIAREGVPLGTLVIDQKIHFHVQGAASELRKKIRKKSLGPGKGYKTISTLWFGGTKRLTVEFPWPVTINKDLVIEMGMNQPIGTASKAKKNEAIIQVWDMSGKILKFPHTWKTAITFIVIPTVAGKSILSGVYRISVEQNQGLDFEGRVYQFTLSYDEAVNIWKTLEPRGNSRT